MIAHPSINTANKIPKILNPSEIVPFNSSSNLSEINAFNLANMGRAFFNSIIVLAGVLSGSIIISSQLAYVLNRFKFKGNVIIRYLFLFATLLPGVAMQVAVYKIMGNLKLIDHIYGYIIMMMGTDVITIYIFIQFMENISDSLDESAIIDGANYFTIFGRKLFHICCKANISLKKNPSGNASQ